MSIAVRFIALLVAWLVAFIAELRELGGAHAGMNVDAPKVPHQWHAEFRVPQPVLLPPLPQGPVPSMVNNSQMVAAQHWQAQQERDALFTMEVIRKNARNAALLTILTRYPAQPAGTAAGT
jgi:hypothetical protein